MGVSTTQSVEHYHPKRDVKTGKLIEHPKLEPGDFHVKGTIEASGPYELCSPKAKLSAELMSLTRTEGGGIAYEFVISKEEPAAKKSKKDEPDEEDEAA